MANDLPLAMNDREPDKYDWREVATDAGYSCVSWASSGAAMPETAYHCIRCEYCKRRSGTGYGNCDGCGAPL